MTSAQVVETSVTTTLTGTITLYEQQTLFPLGLTETKGTMVVARKVFDVSLPPDSEILRKTNFISPWSHRDQGDHARRSERF